MSTKRFCEASFRTAFCVFALEMLIIIINKRDTSNKRAAGTITKSSRKYLSNIPEKHELKEIQKTPILCTHTNTHTHTHTHTHFSKY